MSKKTELFLKELMLKIAGKGSEKIVEVLFNKKNVNEFKIAEKLKMTINQVRNILYKMSLAGIVSAVKKKDKRRGWYIFFWTLDNLKALELLKKIKQKEIEELEKKERSYGTKNYYYCEEDNIEMSEETALHHNFLCPECGKLLQPLKRKNKEIESKKRKLIRELSSIQEEIENLEKKIKRKKEKKKMKEKKKKIKGKSKKKKAKKKKEKKRRKKKK